MSCLNPMIAFRGWVLRSLPWLTPDPSFNRKPSDVSLKYALSSSYSSTNFLPPGHPSTSGAVNNNRPMADENMIECGTCYASKPVNRFCGRKKHKLPCSCMAHITCIACLRSDITERLKSWPDIRPVCFQCHTDLDYQTIRRVMSREIAAKYEEQLTLEALEKDLGFLWCPNPQCKAGEIHDRDCPSFPRVQCRYCKFVSCQLCSVQWHHGMTCAEFSGSKQAQQKTMQSAARLGAKYCTNCNVIVTKTLGCDQVYCQFPP